jgi:WD40 repeat protein
MKGLATEVVQFSPASSDTLLLVTRESTSGHNYSLCDLKSRKSQWLCSEPTQNGFAFAHDGHLLAVLNSERGVTLFEVREESFLSKSLGSRKFLGNPAFSPDGSTLALVTLELGRPLVWLHNVKTGVAEGSIEIGYGDVARLKFSADGKTLATCDYDNVVRFWNVSQRKEMLSFPNLRPMDGGIWFSPRNNALALLTAKQFTDYGDVELFTLPSFEEIRLREQMYAAEKNSAH